MRHSAIQKLGFFLIMHLNFPDYYLGTGLLSVVGPNFASIAAVRYDDDTIKEILWILTRASITYSAVASQMYSSGYCPTEILDDGTTRYLPCRHGWGAILGTCKCMIG